MTIRFSLFQIFVVIGLLCVVIAMIVAGSRETRMYVTGNHRFVHNAHADDVQQRVAKWLSDRKFSVGYGNAPTLRTEFVQPFVIHGKHETLRGKTEYYRGTLRDGTSLILKLYIGEYLDGRELVTVYWDVAGIGPRDTLGRFDENRKEEVEVFLDQFRAVLSNASRLAEPSAVGRETIEGHR